MISRQTLASMLSGIPLAARGPAQIFIFDIHALQERFYFSELVIPRYGLTVRVSLFYSFFVSFLRDKKSCLYVLPHLFPRLLSAMPLLIRELQTLPPDPALSIAFPDEGAWKRFHGSLPHWPSITCIKVRDGDKRVVSIKEGAMAFVGGGAFVSCDLSLGSGDPKDRHVVIVDDLVQTGGTLIECAKVMLQIIRRICIYTHNF